MKFKAKCDKKYLSKHQSLAEYLKTADAAKRFMPLSGSTTGSGSGAQLSISTTGSFNNYGNNGQAFNAVREVTDYNGATGSGYPINAASFGVKIDGTTAFSHKKYDTFNPTTGAATGAKNTAVLVFSGRSGLLYAKNTGSANDVTTDMYKRVGVIDSPDAAQRVYAATQVYTKSEVNTFLNDYTNAQVNALKTRVEDLEANHRMLLGMINILCEKLNVEFTDEELEGLTAQGISPYSEAADEIEIIQEGMINLQETLKPEEIEPIPFDEKIIEEP